MRTDVIITTAKKQNIDAVEFGPKAQDIETIESVQIHDMDAVATPPQIGDVKADNIEPEMQKAVAAEEAVIADVEMEGAEVNSLTVEEWQEKAQQLSLTESNEELQVEDKVEAEFVPYDVTLDATSETAKINNQPPL